MSIDTSPVFSQVDDVDESLAQEEYHDEDLYVDAINREHQLWDLQRELSQTKLALETEIHHLRGEVQDLRLNALRAANDLDKLIARMLAAPGQNPYDPNA